MDNWYGEEGEGVGGGGGCGRRGRVWEEGEGVGRRGRGDGGVVGELWCGKEVGMW